MPVSRLRSFTIILALLPIGLLLDPWIAPILQRAQDQIGGDLRREMEFVQQFGAITSGAIIAWAVWILDPAARRRLVAAAAGCLASALCVFILKIIIGRPRPRLEDPWGLVAPWQTYTWSRSNTPVTRHAWEFWERGTHDIWSMPSAHTASAFALAGVLALLYPALRPLALTLGCAVAVCRVVLGAHYITDVIIGGVIGWMAARAVMRAVLKATDRATDHATYLVSDRSVSSGCE